jgi:hypothetical protein
MHGALALHCLPSFRPYRHGRNPVGAKSYTSHQKSPPPYDRRIHHFRSLERTLKLCFKSISTRGFELTIASPAPNVSSRSQTPLSRLSTPRRKFQMQSCRTGSADRAPGHGGHRIHSVCGDPTAKVATFCPPQRQPDGSTQTPIRYNSLSIGCENGNCGSILTQSMSDVNHWALPARENCVKIRILFRIYSPDRARFVRLNGRMGALPSRNSRL